MLFWWCVMYCTSTLGGALGEANRKLAVVRHLWRLAYEMKVVAIKQYEYGGRLLVGVGRQVGGWRKKAGQ